MANLVQVSIISHLKITHDHYAGSVIYNYINKQKTYIAKLIFNPSIHSLSSLDYEIQTKSFLS